MAHAAVVDHGKLCTGVPAKSVGSRPTARRNTSLPSKASLVRHLRSRQHAGRRGTRCQITAAVATLEAPPRPAASVKAPSASGQGKQTPKALGYTMPGEFEPHANCWMGWPDSPYLWRDNAKPAQKQYADVAKAISQFEPVVVLANPESAAEARAAFEDAPNVSVVEIPINDGWARDWGPACVVKEDKATGKRVVAGTHWDFDSYGGTVKKQLGMPTQVPDWSKDNAAGRRILQHHDMEVFECNLHLEGGSIHTDGEGTLICTEQCLLHFSRNPALDKRGIEEELKEYLGLEKVIWLWKGMAGDDAITNGHVDNLACFVRPGLVLLSWTDDENDPQYEISLDAYNRLTSTPDAKGRRIEVIKVPIPYPLFRTYEEADGVHPDHIDLGYCPRIPGERLPASYINHYVANGGVVVPKFGGYSADRDAEAVRILQKAYGPDRKVVSVASREVLLNAGNVHCITQQNPAPQGGASSKGGNRQNGGYAPKSGAATGFFVGAVGSWRTSGSEAPTKAAPKKASSGGFFDSAVGSKFASRPQTPTKAAPKQPAPRGASAGSSKGFFDSAVGSQFGRSESPAKSAPTRDAPKRSAASKPSSGGFFDSAVGSQFGRSESPAKSAPSRAAPKQPAASKPSSGGGFFDSAVGSQFGRSESPAKSTPTRDAPKRAATSKPSSGGGFFDSAVGSQFGRSESPAKSTPTRDAPKRAAASKPSSGGFFDSAVGSQFGRSESPAKSAPSRAAPKRAAASKPSSNGFFDSAVGSQFGKSESPAKSAPTRAAPKQPAASKPSSGGFFGSAEGFQFERSESPAKSAPARAAPKGTSKGFFESAVGSQFANRTESPKKAAPKRLVSSKPSSGGFF